MPGTFDARKARLSVPAVFRTALAAQGGPQELVGRRSDHSPCIEIWPRGAFDAMVERKLGDLDPFGREYEKASRKLVARVHPLVPDSEGRVVIPKDLVEAAELASGEVVFTGRVRFFQLWSAERWAAVEAADAAERAAEDAESPA